MTKRKWPPLTERQVRSMALLAVGYIVVATPTPKHYRSLVKRGLAVEDDGIFKASDSLIERLRDVREA